MDIKSLIPSMRIHDESKQKKVILVLLIITVLMFLLGFFLNGSSGGHSPKKVARVATSSEKTTAPNKQNIIPKESPEKTAAVKGTVDIAQIYPFIDPKANGVAVATANGTMPVSSGSTGLPAIPNYQPVPNVGSIPLPTIPNSPTMAAPSMMPQGFVGGTKQNSVQGILTSDNGKNMAIMSDGKVVQEGDTYGGEHISYITGDGVHFDSGNAISYGIK